MFFLAGCAPQKAKEIEPGFYYWKTHLSLGGFEKQLLDQLQVNILYIRFFDVDWKKTDTEASPVSILRSDALADTGMKYIPVIYITQRCLLQLKEETWPQLALRIAGLIELMCNRYKINPEEIQIDCDWTTRTFRQYFAFLRCLKEHHFFRNRLLSCTIRMHQVKYVQNSGIPPVDKGLLMIYNMGNLTRYGSQNSILELKEAKSYLKNVGKYPLPLDIALPLYHWAAVFEHQKFKGIAYNLTREDIPAPLLEQVAGNLYRIKADVRVNGFSLKENQEIRFEQSELEEVKEIAGFLSRRLFAEKYKVSFFHLDSAALLPYNGAEIKQILNAF